MGHTTSDPKSNKRCKLQRFGLSVITADSVNPANPSGLVQRSWPLGVSSCPFQQFILAMRLVQRSWPLGVSSCPFQQFILAMRWLLKPTPKTCIFQYGMCCLQRFWLLHTAFLHKKSFFVWFSHIKPPPSSSKSLKLLKYTQNICNMQERRHIILKYITMQMRDSNAYLYF